MIKLIASDLDGTLLDEPNRISKINLDAIEYAYQKGEINSRYLIILCTDDIVV